MGDISDLADVERFTRSREGQRSLDKFREGLTGKRIIGVEFSHLSTGVAISLLLEDGDHLDLHAAINAYDVYTLRDRYKHVLDREYYIDFPERKPGRRSP